MLYRIITYIVSCSILLQLGCAIPSVPAAPALPNQASKTQQPSSETNTKEKTTPTDIKTKDAPNEQPPPQPAPIIRFVVLGDGGEGNETQFAVADSIEKICEERGGCEFALYLGDNFYDDGISRRKGLHDPQFEEKFEFPYANLDFPFYVVLGNHDYGALGLTAEKAAIEVLYSQHSQKWAMPSRYYRIDLKDISLFALDTNAFMVGDIVPALDADKQQAWFDKQVASSSARWKIAFGHHPYISNGQHGNAGKYEGKSWLPLYNGKGVKQFVEQSICGKVDIYFAGHDHNRQWLKSQCGSHFIVSGAAAKTTDLVGRGTPTLFEDDHHAGFLLVEIQGDTLRGYFYRKDGSQDFQHHIIQHK